MSHFTQWNKKLNQKLFESFFDLNLFLRGTYLYGIFIALIGSFWVHAQGINLDSVQTQTQAQTQTQTTTPTEAESRPHSSLRIREGFHLGGSPDWRELLKRELEKVHPRAEIEFELEPQWVHGGHLSEIKHLKFLGDDSKGNAHFILEGKDRFDSHEGWISYSAWMESRVANQKIKPGEVLRENYFLKKKLNVAHGLGREVRALILTTHAPVEELESIRTILEGQPLLSTAVEHIPDIRKGDQVKVFIKAGSLHLVTSAIAQEAGYLRGKLKVTTSQGKRELQGVLQSKSLVEVEL